MTARIQPELPSITPQEFIAKWRDVAFGEKQASQEMFLDICRLVGHPTPVEYGNPEAFTFEKRVPGGSADAYLEGRFGWEFKGSDRQLDEALNQLLRYQVHLKTPPLLIVSSFNTIRIRTNFPGMETLLHEIPVAGLDQADSFNKLRHAFFDPDELRPNRSLEDVTRETADLFRSIVSDMEQRSGDPEKLARYLNQIVFCLYAEDAGLLPDALFTRIVRQHFRHPEVLNRAVSDLFEQMASGGLFGADEIAHFNGDLFSAVDTVELSERALFLLAQASEMNWRSIEPSIFGTLFERALDASKRSQLGAHYTSADDIMLVVEPVVMAPLRAEWEAVQQEAGNLLIEDEVDAARVRLGAFQQRLFEVEVLDPACGSGNFLYLALRCLLDLEKQVIDFAAAHGWPGLAPTVKPDQMLGLEINPYAAELARTALWIGYIQWHQNNGFPYDHSPVLTPLVSIRKTDAILDLSDEANPKEPEWPEAEFIIGNPPFLGHFPFREQLGDAYVEALYSLYGDRIPHASDLCCYWFEKARGQIEGGSSKRAGLLGTQAIRFQSNRAVLSRIKDSGDIFEATSDQNWVLDGATVHISIICFDDGSATDRILDGETVTGINADLTAGLDLTQARALEKNQNLEFQGVGKVGDFDMPEATASNMLIDPNPHGKPNGDVLKRWINGIDIARRARNVWVVDFGVDMPEAEAALYEAPFEYVKKWVKPKRITNNMPWRAQNWWLHGYPAISMRRALSHKSRYIGTPKVSKHRFFVWLTQEMLASNLVIAIASDEDYMLGILSSSIHESWARRLGSQLRESHSGGTYTPTTCFETFPFPRPTEQQRAAIGKEAEELNRLREGWLNPPDASEPELKKRTLTNLYNARPTWLQMVHQRLDKAVLDAYGWPHDLTGPEILERLLALNLERAIS
jgi:type II restriction/modification system DNA methylase subunit YeeA